jgi:hypothetical protein
MKTMVKWMGLLGVAALCAPAFGADAARPGSVNYVEGSAYIDSQPVNARDIGAAYVDAGQVLSTGQGKAEMLLTPGIYLRLDANSAVKMIAPDLTETQVEVDRGKAAVEVDQIFKQNDIEVVEDGVSTRLEKTGYYEFNADRGTVATFKGEALVELNDGHSREVKEHHEFALATMPGGKPLAKEKPASFDEQANEDDLYNWSSLRSEYLAQANNEIAGDYYGAGFYPGWYWDPYAWDYTFIGAGPFWSPFGWGYYPFGWYGGWYGGGWYGGRPIYGHPRPYGHAIHGGWHGEGAMHADGGFHGGFAGGGFHGGGGFAGGGGHGR